MDHAGNCLGAARVLSSRPAMKQAADDLVKEADDVMKWVSRLIWC